MLLGCHSVCTVQNDKGGHPRTHTIIFERIFGPIQILWFVVFTFPALVSTIALWLGYIEVR